MTIEFLDHTADVGVRIGATSPEELIREAARAFYGILLEEGSLERVEFREERRIERTAPDGETSVVDFLNELIYRFDSEKLLLPHVRVEEARLDRSGGRLRARLGGERFDPDRHGLRTEVKAATYHGIEVRESAGLWSVEVIFDL